MASSLLDDLHSSLPCDEQASFASDQAPSYAALPADILRSIFKLVSTMAAQMALAPAGLPLPPLEIWAACPACLAWLGRPEVGVRAVRFIRRAPQHLSDPPLPESAVAAGQAGHFQPSDRRRNWRLQRSVGVGLSEWRRSPADDMLCGLENVDVYSGGAIKYGKAWSFEGWQHLEVLSLKGPATSDNQPTTFSASHALYSLPKLHTLELTGFSAYLLESAPSTLRVLRLIQRQAGVRTGEPRPEHLSMVLGANMRLDSCFFELLPAAGELLAQQLGRQPAVHVNLEWLRSRCRHLEVAAPVLVLDCACPRCAAASQREYNSSGDEDDGWYSSSEGSGSSGLGSVESMDEETLQQALQGMEEYERQHPEEHHGDPIAWLAVKLGQAAAQLVAPGSLLEHVTLRSSRSAPNVREGLTGLQLAFCNGSRRRPVCIPLRNSGNLEAAAASVNETFCGGAATVAGQPAGCAAVAASVDSQGQVPNMLTLQRR